MSEEKIKVKPITTECTRCSKPLILRTHAIYVRMPDGSYVPYCAECNKERLQVQEVLANAANNSSRK